MANKGCGMLRAIRSEAGEDQQVFDQMLRAIRSEAGEDQQVFDQMLRAIKPEGPAVAYRSASPSPRWPGGIL